MNGILWLTLVTIPRVIGRYKNVWQAFKTNLLESGMLLATEQT